MESWQRRLTPFPAQNVNSLLIYPPKQNLLLVVQLLVGLAVDSLQFRESLLVTALPTASAKHKLRVLSVCFSCLYYRGLAQSCHLTSPWQVEHIWRAAPCLECVY